MSVRKKMAKGAFWLFIEKGGQQISSFMVFAVIARLIGPEEYGFVALCIVFLSLATNIINSMVDAVISMNIKDDLRLSSLFWTISLCGALLSLFTFAMAGPFAIFLGHERIAPLLRAYAVLPVLVALAAVPTALVTASMDFRVFTIRTLVATLVGGIVGITMAIKGFGAFALAAQQIVLYVFVNIVVWLGSGWRPRLMFKAKAMAEILRLGLNQAGSSFVTFLGDETPRLILGYFIGPIAVGQYAFVTRICWTLQDSLVQPIVSVVYPAFAQIRDDHGEQRNILDQLLVLLGALLLPNIAGAIVAAPLYVPLFFGKIWEPTVPLLQLFLISVAAKSMNSILRDIMRSHKLIGTYLRAQSVVVLTWLILATAFVLKGLTVFMATSVIISFVGSVVYTLLVARKVNIHLWPNYVRLWAPLTSSIVMCAAMLAFARSPLHPSGELSLFVTEMVLGVVVYAASYSALQFRQLKGMLAYSKKWFYRNKGIATGADL